MDTYIFRDRGKSGRGVEVARWHGGPKVAGSNPVAPTTQTKMAIQLDDKNFDNEINSEKPILVDFWAAWCAPCRAIAPILEEIEKEDGEKIRIGKLNVDEYPDIASRFKIFSIPTLVIFKSGKELGRMVGAAPKSKLKQFIEESLK